jgi:amino acid permease
MTRDRLISIGVMLGTVIGAGFLALPYAAAHSGVATVLFFIGALALVAILLHIAYGEIVLATPGRHRLPGYAGEYLGPLGKNISGIAVIVGQLGGLLVYLLFGGAFISALLPEGLWLEGSVIFWVILTALLLMKFRASATVDALASWCLVLGLIGISLFAFGKDLPDHFQIQFSPSLAQFFLPYGIVMFSLMGLAAVPELASFKNIHNKKALTSVLIFGITGAAILYALFAWSVSGMIGQNASANAFLDIRPFLPNWASWLIPVIGLIAIGTSYFTFGVSTKNVLTMDFGINRVFAAAIVASVPITLFLLGMHDIARIIGFLGGVWIGIEAITILLMRERLHAARVAEDGILWRKNIVSRALMAVFIFGAISSLIVIK